MFTNKVLILVKLNSLVSGVECYSELESVVVGNKYKIKLKNYKLNLSKK